MPQRMFIGMDGMNATTGKRLVGIDHLRQSIRDILTTPIGSRVLRREYGSRLFELIDAPYSASTKLAIMAATVEALLTWEPRILVQEVKLATHQPGHITVDLLGKYLPDGRDVALEGIEVT